MADNPAPASATTSTPPAATGTTAAPNPPRQGSLMLPFLIGALLVVVGWYAYDQFIAKVQTNAADEAIRKLADERNRQSITGPDGKKVSEGRVVSADIQKVLGRAPFSVKNEKQYTLETYWWYSMPHRNYVVVLYLGNEPRRYNTHFINRYPEAEDLPVDLDLPPAKPGSTATENAQAAEKEPPAKAEPLAEEGNASPASGEASPAKDAPAAPAEDSPPKPKTEPESSEK